MIRRPPRSPLSSSSAASDVYKRQEHHLLMTAGSDCHRPGDEGTTGILAETLPEDSFGYADLIRSGKYTLIRPE